MLGLDILLKVDDLGFFFVQLSLQEVFYELTGQILRPKHITSYTLGTWGLMHICSSERLWFYPPQSDYIDDHQEYGKLHDRKVAVHPKSINWSLGATQANLTTVLLQVPVHINIMNRPLGATGIDSLSQS